MNRLFLGILTIVLILHILALFHLSEQKPKEKTSKPSGSIAVKIVQPSKPEEVKSSIQAPSSSSEVQCKSWYYGFGFNHNWIDNEIGNVVPGYPGHKAGILAGDILVSIEDSQGNTIPMSGSEFVDQSHEGEVGVVTILRQGALLRFTMRRVKICTE